MHILLSGKRESPVGAVAEELKKRWAALGTAVYCVDARTPLNLIKSACHSVAGQFGYTGEGDLEDLFLQTSLLEWGRAQDLKFWGKIARRSVDQVTGRWEEMGLFHVSVIQNLAYREDFELFPRAYRAYLLPPKDAVPHMIYGHHPSETALDKWISDSKTETYPIFDLVIPADEGSPEEIAGLIFDGFNERFQSGFRTFFN